MQAKSQFCQSPALQLPGPQSLKCLICEVGITESTDSAPQREGSNT